MLKYLKNWLLRTKSDGPAFNVGDKISVRTANGRWFGSVVSYNARFLSVRDASGGVISISRKWILDFKTYPKSQKDAVPKEQTVADATKGEVSEETR